MTDAYVAFRDTEPCHRCGDGESWTVKGPDGVCIGQSWTGDNAECNAEEEAHALNAAFALGHAGEQKAIDYSIKLQRLIENLKYPDTAVPYPKLHHHKMIVAAKVAMYGHAGSSPAPLVPQGDAVGSGTGDLTAPQGHPLDEWDEYEEYGPLDLEDAFDRTIERAFARSASNRK